MNRMNLKNRRKKAAALLLLLLICAGCLTGCGGNTKLVFTTGLSGNQLFKIGSAECELPEAMIYLTTFYNQYADSYGVEMWNHDFGGISLEEDVKEVVLSKLVQIKIMNLMAQERGISLTAEEKAKVLAAAEAYDERLGEPLKEKEGITGKVIERVFTEYALANKVYETITGSEDMEISDDEARTVTVQMITLPTLDKAADILKRVRMGADFETAAAQAGAPKAVMKNIARGEVEPELEELLFSLDEGAVSEVAETSDGYVIVKCFSTMDYEATQANKLALAQKRKSEAFSDAYREIAGNTYFQFRDRLWEKVSMNEEIHRTEADFFAVYKNYVKQ